MTLVQSLHTVFLLTDAALVKDGDDLSPASKYCFFLRADAAEQLEQSRMEMTLVQSLNIVFFYAQMPLNSWSRAGWR